MIDRKGLVDSGLVNEKTFSDYPDLRMYKYKNKVFYKGLWNVHPDITECRGLVLDTSGNVVVLPFKKVFNYKENGTKFPKNSVVKLVEKKNGFFAAASLYNNEVLVSTTGSLDSPFTKMAKEMLDLESVEQGLKGMDEALAMKGTMMFEICHKNDPHIVKEDHGVYLIGFRVHNSGLLVPEEVLDRIAYACNAESGKEWMFRPNHEYCTFKQALKKVKDCRHEGYMVYKKGSRKVLKLKSPHYLTKKFLMRMSDSKVEFMFDNREKFKETIDEEFYDVVNFVTNRYSLHNWTSKTDQERRKIIEHYFGG